MRISIVVLLAVVLGAGLGMASTLAEFGSSNEESSSLETSGAPLLPVEGPPARAVLVAPHFEFGEMDQDEVGRHTFVLKNEGPGALTLGEGKPSCKCTIASISKKRIEPGDQAEIAVEWRPQYVSGEFSRNVTFPTNDRTKPNVTFEIHGTVLTAFRLEPGSIVLGAVSPNETRESTVKLYAFKEKEFEILGHEFGNKPTAEFFGLVYEPLPKKDLDEAKAKAGYQLTVVARKGMPIGPLIQTLTIKTSLASKSPISLPIYGQVTPEISIVGPRDFNRDKNILFLGVTPKGKGHPPVQLSMILCGPKRKEVKFEVVKVVPEDLKVEIGAATQWPGGTSTQIPLRISVPATAKPVALLGTDPAAMGKIVLKSNHPEYKELTINVRMAVTDDAPAANPDQAAP